MLQLPPLVFDQLQEAAVVSSSRPAHVGCTKGSDVGTGVLVRDRDRFYRLEPSASVLPSLASLPLRRAPECFFCLPGLLFGLGLIFGGLLFCLGLGFDGFLRRVLTQ